MVSKKVTIDVLSTKLDGLDNKLDDIKQQIKDVQSENKVNTEFRLKAQGMMIAVGGVAGFVSAALFWVLNLIVK